MISLRRIATVASREAIEIARDRFRLISAFAVPLSLMLALGFGFTLDIERVSYAVLDQDGTPQSRDFAAAFAHSRFLDHAGDLASQEAIERALAGGVVRLAIEIPSGFGRALAGRSRPEVAFWIDGSMPYRAETIKGIVLAIHNTEACRGLEKASADACDRVPLNIRTRFLYNQELKSRVAFVPGLIAVILAMVPAMLTAVAVVREKELGTITNFYTSPLTPLEFLVGKQLPCAAISFANFLMLTIIAIVVFKVLPKGGILLLLSAAILYILATTAIGLLVSCFTRSQMAGFLITLIVTVVPAFLFSGLLIPVGSIEASGKVLAYGFPTTWFLRVVINTFAKNAPADLLFVDFVVLTVFLVVLMGLSVALLDKQRR